MKTMEDYSFYCTAEQTKRLHKLGAPIQLVKSRRTSETIISNDVIECDDTTFTYVVPPTTQQAIGWLIETLHLVSLSIDYYTTGITRSYGFSFINKDDICICRKGGEFYTYKQAELAAIDAALDYLEKGGKV